MCARFFAPLAMGMAAAFVAFAAPPSSSERPAPKKNAEAGSPADAMASDLRRFERASENAKRALAVLSDPAALLAQTVDRELGREPGRGGGTDGRAELVRQLAKMLALAPLPREISDAGAANHAQTSASSSFENGRKTLQVLALRDGAVANASQEYGRPESFLYDSDAPVQELLYGVPRGTMRVGESPKGTRWASLAFHLFFEPAGGKDEAGERSVKSLDSLLESLKAQRPGPVPRTPRKKADDNDSEKSVQWPTLERFLPLGFFAIETAMAAVSGIGVDIAVRELLGIPLREGKVASETFRPIPERPPVDSLYASKSFLPGVYRTAYMAIAGTEAPKSPRSNRDMETLRSPSAKAVNPVAEGNDAEGIEAHRGPSPSEIFAAAETATSGYPHFFRPTYEAVQEAHLLSAGVVAKALEQYEREIQRYGDADRQAKDAMGRAMQKADGAGTPTPSAAGSPESGAESGGGGVPFGGASGAGGASGGGSTVAFGAGAVPAFSLAGNAAFLAPAAPASPTLITNASGQGAASSSMPPFTDRAVNVASFLRVPPPPPPVVRPPEFVRPPSLGQKIAAVGGFTDALSGAPSPAGLAASPGEVSPSGAIVPFKSGPSNGPAGGTTAPDAGGEVEGATAAAPTPVTRGAQSGGYGVASGGGSEGGSNGSAGNSAAAKAGATPGVLANDLRPAGRAAAKRGGPGILERVGSFAPILRKRDLTRRYDFRVATAKEN